MKHRIKRFQWTQLAVLAIIHFTVDMFAGALPAILPVLMSTFSIRLSLAVGILTALNLTANGVQIIIGHLRHDKKRPAFLQLGLILSAAVCLLGLLPANPQAYPLLIILAIICGCGVAMVHPEALRAVHKLRRISSAISTTYFLSFGFFGYAAGGYIAATLVSHLHLPGLYWLFVLPVLAAITVKFFRIRLSVERKSNAAISTNAPTERLSFWPIFAVALMGAISTTIIFALLPTRLNELGFSLTFGGFCYLAFGLSWSLGSLLWANLARKIGELRSALFALVAGLPFFFIYFASINSKPAVLILIIAGSCSPAYFPLMVSLARHAAGMKLGQRMGFIIGGAWGTASLVLLAVSPLAEHFGLQTVLNWTPLGYLASALIVLSLLRKKS
ncbi:MFS transporter [Planctomycetota bacterium]